VSRNPTIPRAASTEELRALANAYLDCGIVRAEPPAVWQDGQGNLVSWFYGVALTYVSQWMMEENVSAPPQVDPLLLEQCQIEAIRRGRTSLREQAFWGPVLVEAEAQIAKRIAMREHFSGTPEQHIPDIYDVFNDALASYARSQGLVYRTPAPSAPGLSYPAAQAPAVMIVLSRGTGTVYLAPWYRYRVRRVAEGLEVALKEEFRSWGVHDSKGTPASLLGTYACYVKYDGPPLTTTAVERKEVSPMEFFARIDPSMSVGQT